MTNDQTTLLSCPVAVIVSQVYLLLSLVIPVGFFMSAGVAYALNSLRQFWANRQTATKGE